MKFCGEYHFVMPYNIHFKFEDNFVKEILRMDAKLADIMIHDIENGIIKKLKTTIFQQIASFFVSIQKIGGYINSFFYKVDKKKCIKCGKCSRMCPENNITIKNNKVKFGHHCNMCMRCSFYCPTDAINIGFINGWRVNGDYNLNQLALESNNSPPYINENSKGFYKCFIKYFKNINTEYELIFGKDAKPTAVGILPVYISKCNKNCETTTRSIEFDITQLDHRETDDNSEE